jgi:hypothetical protein
MTGGNKGTEKDYIQVTQRRWWKRTLKMLVAGKAIQSEE